jgi:hypothetical protein
MLSCLYTDKPCSQVKVPGCPGININPLAYQNGAASPNYFQLAFPTANNFDPTLQWYNPSPGGSYGREHIYEVQLCTWPCSLDHMAPYLTAAQWAGSFPRCLRTHSWRRCGRERPSALGSPQRCYLLYALLSRPSLTGLILLQIKSPLQQCLPTDAMAMQRYMPWLDSVVNGMKASVCERNVTVAVIAHTFVFAGYRRQPAPYSGDVQRVRAQEEALRHALCRRCVLLPE